MEEVPRTLRDTLRAPGEMTRHAHGTNRLPRLSRFRRTVRLESLTCIDHNKQPGMENTRARGSRMHRSKIGIALESLDLPLRAALNEAQRLAVSGVEVAAVGELAPAKLSETGRREFRHLLRGHSLELTALRCP